MSRYEKSPDGFIDLRGCKGCDVILHFIQSMKLLIRTKTE